MGDGPAHQAVRSALDAELADRRMRDRVFAPLLPFLRRADASVSSVARAWRKLKAADPAALDAEAADLFDGADPSRTRAAADRLVGLAADSLDADDPELRLLLRLAPLARATLPKARNYLRTSSEEHAAALRLAYRDAAALHEDAPPRLVDVLAAHLDQPSQALRLVCALMDRPDDFFLAGSELGRFGEVVLDDVDQRLHAVRTFSAEGGRDAGRDAASAVAAAVQALGEFDRCLQLSVSGPWAKRIVAQRRDLARMVEARLRQADPAVSRALPTSGARRITPNLRAQVDPRARTHALALTAFAAGVRGAAETGGFAAARTKTLEALDHRLAVQGDELLRIAHEEAGEPADAARERLGFVAELLADVRDPQAAELVRRRAAAA